MKILNSPWRESYVKETHKTQTDCTFCQKIAETTDEKNYILGRYKHSFVVMNKYPYNAGHLLIIPFEHVATIDKLSKGTRAEIMELIAYSTTILQKQFNNPGTNVGINMGKAAGAGIPDHLHVHVLPRWHGDTNFLPVFADAKQVAVDMAKMYTKLKPHFAQFKIA